MARFLPASAEASSLGCTGVLLANVGTPAAPTAKAVRKFLASFLADRRVVDLPRTVWLPILYGAVLTVRPARSARAYRSIWTEAGSPLRVNLQQLVQGLQSQFEQMGQSVVRVVPGMCYGEPSIANALDELRNSGVRKLIVLPLFPQYSSSTTAAVFDAVARELSRWRRVPQLHFVQGYHDHPAYIAALANSVREAWDAAGQPSQLLFSFHGVPQRYVDAGDPYEVQCQETAKAVAKALGLRDGEWHVGFQSRFGRAKWLEPDIGTLLAQQATQGQRAVTVIAPSFSLDCVETLEEIGIRYREAFLGVGGKRFTLVPALNAREDHVRALRELCAGLIQV